jgi:hypothetical protein
VLEVHPEHRSFNSVQKARASQRAAELRDLVVTGLSHLVRANPQSGFKQCLPLAYDADPQKRMIFAHVFARVLGQGTKFEPPGNSVTAIRQARLREVRYTFPILVYIC